MPAPSTMDTLRPYTVKQDTGATYWRNRHYILQIQPDSSAMGQTLRQNNRQAVRERFNSMPKMGGGACKD